MSHSWQLRTTRLLGILLLAFFLLATPVPSSATPNTQAETLTGYLAIIRGDAAPGSGLPPTTNYYLTQDNGVMTELVVSESAFQAAGGALSLNGKRVTIVGDRVRLPQRGEQLFLQTREIRAEGPEVSPELSGTQPWVTLGCKFADVSDEPKTESYLQTMYSSSYPGLDHYWRELSYGNMNLTGSTAVAWVTLPHPRAYYTSIWQIEEDCTGAADALVDYRNYTGIQLALNYPISAYSFGGRSFTSLDGELRVWLFTWLMPWGYNDIVVAEHEMGHGFDLPDYDPVKDPWDVMSDFWANCSNSRHPVYGCLGQHTIPAFKDHLGWLEDGRKYTIGAGTQANISLERLALPQNSGRILVKIPIGGSSTLFYTLEARRRVGYDLKLPGEGVILHQVNTYRVLSANVLGTDVASAIQSPGEVFADETNKIYVCVNSESATGYNVTVPNGLKPGCAIGPSPTPTPIPVRATGANVLDLAANVKQSFQLGEPIVYYGEYLNGDNTTHLVDLAFNVEGPCGSIQSTEFPKDVYPDSGYEFLESYIPEDACLGQYTFIFRVTDNGESTASKTFSVVAFHTATPTYTPDGPWIYCAAEDEFCEFSGTKQVRYGASGKYFIKTFTDGVSCSNDVFGDPVYGEYKHCWHRAIPPTATATNTRTPSRTPTPTYTPDGVWNYCAKQNQTCQFSGTKPVRYGVDGKYIVKTFTNGVSCTDANFGDPAPGLGKHCWYSDTVLTVTATPTATRTWTPTPTPSATATATPTDVPPPPPTDDVCSAKPGKPVHLFPSRGATVSTRRVHFDWEDVRCADSYTLKLRADSKKGPPVATLTDLTQSEATVKKLERGRTLFWRVRACNAFGCTNSPWLKFTVSAVPAPE